MSKVKKIKIEDVGEAFRIVIPKENVVEEQGVAVAVIPKLSAEVEEIPEEKIRECGETLMSAMLVLIRAKHALERGDVKRADVLLSSAPVLMVYAGKACSIEIPSDMSVEIMSAGTPEEIKLRLVKAKKEIEEELKEMVKE